MGRDANIVVPDHMDWDEVIAEAERERGPFPWAAKVCLFSGGNDSAVLAHRCRDFYDELVFIDTGTALPGVVDHVEHFAARVVDKPLRIFHAGDAWRKLVLELGGFPGPAGHARAFTRLKERQIDEALRHYKKGLNRRSRVMFLTGKRRAESARRSQTTVGVDRTRGKVFVNPLVNWDNDLMRQYRREADLPQSDVAALIHRSGECNCGAFASKGEREELRSLWPGWFEETIASLEREAEAQGIPACKWGVAPPKKAAAGQLSFDEIEGPLCSTCVFNAQESGLL